MYCINVKMSSYLLKLIFKNNLKDDVFLLAYSIIRPNILAHVYHEEVLCVFRATYSLTVCARVVIVVQIDNKKKSTFNLNKSP